MTKESVIGTKEQRQNRIGGSEFATVLGINPYKKRIELILEKAGVITNTFEGNDATRRGEFLENDIIAMFEDETGLSVTNEQEEFIIQPKDCLELRCHVDGITSDDCVFEAKTTDKKSKTWDNGIPEGYKAQLEFNCRLARKTKAYIAVGICDGNEIINFKWYSYEPQKSLLEIIEVCQEFTKDIEQYKTIGVVNNGLILKTKINENLINELSQLNDKISEIKKQLKPYEDRKKEIESLLKKQIGSNYGIEDELYKITLSNKITSPILNYKVSRSTLKIEYK